MTSTPSSSRPLRTRKLTHTYSLTVDGDSFLLTSLPSSPSCGMAAVRTLPSSPSSHDMPNQTFSSVGSNARLYAPYIPVPRGPRSSNLYLYRPTDADYAKARRRSIMKAAATEDARKEREDDERRRNVILGISVPRKTMRRTRSTANMASEQDITILAAGTPASVVKRPGWRDRRAVVKTKSFVQSELSIGDASASTVSPSTSRVSLPPSSEGLKSAKKPRQKQPLKSNPRPTPRLTTRSQAKAKVAILTGERDTPNASIAPSETGYPGTIDVDIGDQYGLSSVANLEHHLTAPSSHKRAATDSKLGSMEYRLDDSDNLTSLSGGSSLPSFDTLCENTERIPPDFPKEAILPLVGDADLQPDIFPSSSRSSSSTAISLMRRSASPPFNTSPCLPTNSIAAKNNGRDKRKLEEMETQSQESNQTQSRRSSRVPKKRKLH